MSDKTKSQLLAESLALRTRLAEMETRLAKPGNGDGAEIATDSVERARIEEALKASEVRYRRLFETAKDGILILDADTGTISDSNPFLEQMLGYAHAEMVGRKLWEIAPFKDVTANQEAFRELQSEEYIRYEDLPLETKLGGRRQVEFISNVYLVDSSRVVQCNIRDITARKVAEAHIQKANAELSSMVAQLQRHDADMTMLNRMNDLLQSCETHEEAYRVIALAAVELFGGQPGCLAAFDPTGQSLETVARWGGERLVTAVFSLGDCWAIRRGRLHEVTDPGTSLVCDHFSHLPEFRYLCLPLMVQGETLGVLYLSDPRTREGSDPVARHQLVVMAGETIKLSLANLKLRRKLREQATRDPLTGLFNRRYLLDTLPRELHRALRLKAPLSIAMLDLDLFKRINDTFGHDAGDLVLRESGRVLMENVRKSDIACRYGGEEFVLVLPDSPLEDARHRIEQLRILLETLEIRHEGQLLGTMTVSGGIAAAPEHAANTEELLRAADAALYAAKRAGRNCIVIAQTRA